MIMQDAKQKRQKSRTLKKNEKKMKKDEKRC